MNYKNFIKLSKSFNTIPIYKKIIADLLTPISVYMRLAANYQFSFILESVEKGKRYGRYSYIGIDPIKIIKSHNKKTYQFINGEWFEQQTDFLCFIRNELVKYNAPELEGLPSFTGGFVGNFSFESIQWIEKIPIYKQDKINSPDSILMLFNEIIAFDHLKNEIILFSNVNINKKNDLKSAYKNAIKKIDSIGKSLHNDINYETPKTSKKSNPNSNMTKYEFIESVQKAKEYIKSGEVFQLVLSQQFNRKTTVDSITLYRALRTINPSPYMFHIKINNFKIIGSSPELLVKSENKKIELRPIAGTYPRGKNLKEDKILSKKLLNNEKEKAEHLMLVDLGRNDIGKVSKINSVTVKNFMEIEYYSHVMHIVSSINGELSSKKDIIDILYSCFPAGTVTGAPKIRAMEIIHKLEKCRRGFYAGAIGYFDFRGNINTCIAIRTMVMKNKNIYFQSGAGIVFNSDPEKEYEETINKAKAMNSAIDFAENGLIQ